MSGKQSTTKKVGKWYFGGLAGSAVVCCTHPLDLIKVHLQTQHSGKVGIVELGVRVFRTDGIIGFYNGLTAAVMRQMMFTLIRFGIYEIVKKELESQKKRNITFYESSLLSGASGFIGGIVGTPADIVNNAERREVVGRAAEKVSYKNVFDGMIRIVRTEGSASLMNGATMASTRAAFMNFGQISFYAQFKVMLMSTGRFRDNIITHITASFLAGGVATLLTMPIDVMKTRMMNAPKGKYNSILACARDIGAAGPLGFFKGFLPAFVRLGPHTILLFVFFEQLRLRFGDDVPV